MFVWNLVLTHFTLSQFVMNWFIKCCAGFIETFDEEIQEKCIIRIPEQLLVKRFSLFPLL